MAATLKLEIVTPDAVVYSEDVHMVTLPGIEGQIGIYPQHLPLLTQIVPGEIIVRKDGVESFLAVGEGVVEITAQRVAIVTDMAIPSDHIDDESLAAFRQPRCGSGPSCPPPHGRGTRERCKTDHAFIHNGSQSDMDFSLL